MSLTRNLSLIFASVPRAGLPVPGKDLIIEDRPFGISMPPSGGLITRNLYSSLDPYLRLMLIDPSTKHYRKPFTLNEPLRSIGIAKIIASDHIDYRVGMKVRMSVPIAEYSIFTAEYLAGLSKSGKPKVLSEDGRFRDVYWLGPLGMPGLSAYAGLYEIGKPKGGDTIFVSAAAGAVGHIVGQVAKAEGMRVLGSVGDERKLEIIKTELGFDDGFIYKGTRTKDALNRLAPDGIDIYFDNVGGETLEDAIGCMRKGGRIVGCGMLSQYNREGTGKEDTGEGGYGVRNLFQFVSKGLTMMGFQVGDEDFGPKYEREFEDRVGRWMEDGKLKAVISEMGPIETAAEAFVGMLKGEALGKAVVSVVSDESDRHGWWRI